MNYIYRVLIASSLLMTMFLAIAPSAEAVNYNCGNDEFCFAGDNCNPEMNQGVSSASATYQGTYQGNSYPGGYASATATATLDERRVYSDCSYVTLHAYLGDTTDAEVTDCGLYALVDWCRAYATVGVTVDGVLDTDGAHCSVASGGDDCYDKEAVHHFRDARASDGLQVNVPNTQVVTTNWAYAKVDHRLSDGTMETLAERSSPTPETLVRVGLTPL